MKIGIICNHEVSLLTIQLLAYNNMLASVAIHDANHELKNMLAPFCNDAGIDLHVFSKTGFNTALASWLDKWEFDAVWIMTSPFIIPASQLKKPRFGFINFHFGLLPQYRGANPVFEQIRRMESHGGITIHHVNEGIDRGAVILQRRVPIARTDTYAMHMNKLAMPCMETAKQLLQMMMSGNALPAFAQNDEEACYYRRPAPEDVVINWELMSANEIIALCNACNPWNKGAAAVINGMIIAIVSARLTDGIQDDITPPGTIINIDKINGLMVYCADNSTLLVDVIYTQDGFLPGHALEMYNIKKGTSFNTIGNTVGATIGK